MKALTCEMCGSTNLIKDGGVFVCQSCGTKYSVEEAKKMMIDGVVSVKVDVSDELKNLYEVARRAKDADNSENAHKYYDMILVKDPNSWEATFYVTYYQTMQCKIAEISSAAISLSNSFSSVLNLVKTNIEDIEEQRKVIEEIYLRCNNIARMLYFASKDFYEGTDIEIRGEYASEHVERGLYSAGILNLLSVEIKSKFNDRYDDIRADAISEAVDLHAKTLLDVKGEVTEEDLDLYKEDYEEIVKKFHPDYSLPIMKLSSSSNSSSGCYIATAVYGSYDCPEVWTLRRFRDYTLSETWYGRLFIKTYYATSPTLVKYFGNSIWFKKLFATAINKLVKHLKNKGVECTPYKDKIFK